MSTCQNLFQALERWREVLEELDLATDAYLSQFDEETKKQFEEARGRAEKAKKDYLEVKENSFVEVEIKGKRECLFQPEYDALVRLYEGCELQFLEEGEITIENGRVVVLSLFRFPPQIDTEDAKKARTQAFKNIRYLRG